jgi:hypothetical protein
MFPRLPKIKNLVAPVTLALLTFQMILEQVQAQPTDATGLTGPKPDFDNALSPLAALLPDVSNLALGSQSNLQEEGLSLGELLIGFEEEFKAVASSLPDAENHLGRQLLQATPASPVTQIQDIVRDNISGQTLPVNFDVLNLYTVDMTPTSLLITISNAGDPRNGTPIVNLTGSFASTSTFVSEISRDIINDYNTYYAGVTP